MTEGREYEKLRSLLFERELQTLERLRQDVKALEELNAGANRAENLSEALAEALAIRGRRDGKLNAALTPAVDEIVRRSLRTKLPEFTNALFPLMGPAIRKSIAEAFRGMLQSFSKSMETSFSLRGLRWRLEALRTGKSFSEVVLLHTLVYRVEQVFFIHNASGLSLAHVSGEGVASQDADMVSAMLTAIQNFVRDCLDSGRGNDLDSLGHGEHTILVERQATAYLACIVRGAPPERLREQIRACLEDLTVMYFAELAAFNGDTAPFESSRPYLEELLKAGYRDEKAVSAKSRVCLALLAALALGGLGYCGTALYRERALERRALEALEALRREPGLLVIRSAPKGDGLWEALCLRDPFAATPAEALRRQGLDPSIFEFESAPFISYQPEIMQKRIQAALDPPAGVELKFSDDGLLTMSGPADVSWILEARRRAVLVPGVRAVEAGDLYDPRLYELSGLIRVVESAVVEFPSGKDVPEAHSMPALNQAVDKLVELEKLAAGMGLSVTLTIYGHADATGSAKRNFEISQARAKTIAALLYAKGSSLPVLTYGLGADYAGKSGEADRASRRIEMRVRIFQDSEMPREATGR